MRRVRRQSGELRHMRQGQQNRRGRGRGRKPQNPLARNYESNGPDVKIRGTAAHVAEKYMSLARDALASGDTVTAESYLQHAEHYNRIIMAAQSQTPAKQAGDQPQGQPQANGGGQGRQDTDGDDEDVAETEADAASSGHVSEQAADRGRGRKRRNGAHSTRDTNGAEATDSANTEEGESAQGVAG